MESTKHFRDMLEERGINPSWVERTITTPEEVEDHDDDTRHFLKRIEEHGNRWLRVVVNIRTQPHKAVTAFFDRRMRDKE
jgi:hypothetical protein